MYGNHSSVFLLGHTCRFIPGILFLNYSFTRNFHSALQIGCNHIWGINPYPFRHWVVSGFCIFSVWWGWNGVPWLLSSGSYELHDAVLLLTLLCLPCFFAWDVFLFLHWATSVLFSWPKSVIPLKPLMLRLPPHAFSASSFWFHSTCILSRVMFLSIVFE